MVKDKFEEAQRKKEAMKKQLIHKDVKELEKTLKSKKYSAEVLIADSPLSGVYHDLVDDKDKMDAKLQSHINQAYNEVDTKLYKLNKKIENKSRLINYKIDEKQKEILK